MDFNDDAGSLTPRGVLESIASKLAPTERLIYPAHKKTGLNGRFFYASNMPYSAAAFSVR
jgi:hypothetical protein